MAIWTLGISYGFHDSGVALLKDGVVDFAAQEERFTRQKQTKSFPTHAIERALAHAKISLTELSDLYYYEDSDLKFDRIEKTYQSFGLRGARTFFDTYPAWKEERRFTKRNIREKLLNAFGQTIPENKIHFVAHHRSHAASAFYPSPFSEAVVLCIDGVGEWATTSAWLGRGNTLEPIWEIHFPHSLGLLYSAITYFCGFKVDSGEYKVMGLAPYGKPIYADIIREKIIDIKDDGSFWLNSDYFDYLVGDCMVSEKFNDLFDGPPREPESPLTEREFDLAASVQAVVETAVLRMANSLSEETGINNICLAGGVALNCVANGKLLKSGIFDGLWVQPAAGDCGGALGAALDGWHKKHSLEREPSQPDGMQHAYLGTEYSNDEITNELRKLGAKFETLSDEDLISQTAEIIEAGNVVGWFQGRMEFGPRALGGRSIIGDARSEKMQTTMNLKIKYRESFRPFAPVILEEKMGDWFELAHPSPYMLLVVDVHKQKWRSQSQRSDEVKGLDLLKQIRSEIPAVTHVDMSARVQTVTAQSNPKFHSLLTEFERRTGCPVLINTSFNVRGEPIVESPEHAYRCFMRTEMDYLVLGNQLLKKTDQPKFEDIANWQDEFVLD